MYVILVKVEMFLYHTISTHMFVHLKKITYLE